MVKCCDIHSGMLRTKIQIQRLTAVPDGEGGQSDIWASDPAEGVLAHIKPLSGGERWQADRTVPGNKYRIIIRFRGDANGNPYYTSADKVLNNGREWGIMSVTDVDFRRRWIEIIAVENEPS